MVAAERVAPRQPIHHHRRLVGDKGKARCQHRLVRAQHAVGVDDGLGISGRARGEQKLCDGVRRNFRMCGRNAGVVTCAQEIAEHRDLAVAQRIARDHQLDIVRHRCVKRTRERPAVIGEYKPGCQQREDRAQLAEVGRHQGIGRGDRRIGNADIHCRQCKQCVLDVVAGQHDERPFGRQTAPQQCGANSLHVGKNLRVSELAPLALRVALRKVDAIRRNFRPMFEWLTQIVVIAPKCPRRANMDDATGAVLDDWIERPQPHGTQRCLALHFSRYARHRLPDGRHQLRVTFGARFSRKSFRRAFASGSACAIADISASTA